MIFTFIKLCNLWMTNPKRFCSVHLTVFADGKDRVKPLVIFRGTGKRIPQREKDQWHNKVKVEFQKDAWMDENQVRKYILSQLCRGKEPGKLLLTLDAHPAQRTAAMKELMHSKQIFDVEVAKGCTGEVQVLDVAFNKEFKRLVQESYDAFVEKNMESLENGKISASQKRILITKWVGSAWIRFHPFPVRVYEPVIKAFQSTGVTLPCDGSRDDEIKIHGLENYKVGINLGKSLPSGRRFHMIEAGESDYEDSLGDPQEITISDGDLSDSGGSGNETDDYVPDSDFEEKEDDEILESAGPSTSSGYRHRSIEKVQSSDSSSDDEKV